MCEKYLCKRKCIGIYDFFICRDMLSLLILECDILFYVYAIPSKVLITFAAFQFYVSSFPIFADLGWFILVGWSWLVDLHSQDLGWLVVDKFLHKQGNKDVPAGTELLSSPLLNMIFINPLSTHTCQPTGENVLTLSPRDENGEKLSEGTPELVEMRIRGVVVVVVVV